MSPSDSIISSSSLVINLDLISSSLVGKIFCTTYNKNISQKTKKIYSAYRADSSDREDIREYDVSHDAVRELQSLRFLIIEDDQSMHLHSKSVRAGEPGVLSPPPAHHLLHEESEEEGEVLGERINIGLEV